MNEKIEKEFFTSRENSKILYATSLTLRTCPEEKIVRTEGNPTLKKQ